MKTSLKGINLIKKFEGFKFYPYTCPAGKLTVGYGHVIGVKEQTLAKATSPISEEKAEEMLKRDIATAENVINSSIKVTLTQGQFDALVSLVYNWGGYYFKASKGFKALNKGRYQNASFEFFDKEKGVVRVSGKILPGLVKRRQAEFLLWSGDYE